MESTLTVILSHFHELPFTHDVGSLQETNWVLSGFCILRQIPCFF